MFLSIIDYQVIDIENRNRSLAVVCEATSRTECEDYLRVKRLAECECFKESDEEIYRGICRVTTVKSNEDKIVR